MIRFITKETYYQDPKIVIGETRYKRYDVPKFSTVGMGRLFFHKCCYYLFEDPRGVEYRFIYLKDLRSILIPEPEWSEADNILTGLEADEWRVDFSEWKIKKIGDKRPWTINEHKRDGFSYGRPVFNSGLYEIENSKTSEKIVFSVYFNDDWYSKTSHFGFQEKADHLTAPGENYISSIIEKEGLIEQIMIENGGDYKRTDIKS